MTELQRENDRLNDRLKSVSPNTNSSQRDIESLLRQKDELANVVDKLQNENETLKVILVIAFYCTHCLLFDVFVWSE